MNSRSKTTAALITAAGAAVPASAIIIHTDLPEPISAGADESVYFSLSDEWAATTDQETTQFTLSFGDSISEKPKIGTTSSSAVAMTGVYVSNFAEGESIPNDQFSSGNYLNINYNGNNDANWAAGTRGYVGLRIGDEGSYNYGWADIEYASDTLSLYGFAYENNGDPIAAGSAIPEPSTTALFAALAAGSAVMLGRRRRAAGANE